MRKENIKECLEIWQSDLVLEGKSRNTIKQYVKSIELFLEFLEREKIEGELTPEVMLKYKSFLKENYSVNTANARISALNNFLNLYQNNNNLKIPNIKQTKTNVLDETITLSDYERLLRWSKKLNKPKMSLIMQVLAGTGIRISELQYLTLEVVKSRNHEMCISNKNSVRTVVIPDTLAHKLKTYAQENGIESGIIFCSRKNENGKWVNDTDKMLSPQYIWSELKEIAGKARVKKEKVHAHSFRHFFAKEFMKRPNANPFMLKEILGHSSFDTTSIYTKPTTKDQRDEINEFYKDFINRF